MKFFFSQKVMRPSFKECKVWSDEKYVSHKLAFDAKDPHLNFTFNVLKVLYLFLCLSLSPSFRIFSFSVSLSLFLSLFAIIILFQNISCALIFSSLGTQ